MLVSINCIAYNHEKFISKALDSFLMQKTNFEYEILIGEDCSTDRTREIIESYRAKYPNMIKIITSENNVGAKENSERVFHASIGKYIALCEGDDYWIDEHKLQKQVDYLESHVDCSMCIHSAKVIDENGTFTGHNIRPYSENRVCLTEDIIYHGGGFCATASIMFRREVMEEAKNFFKHAHVGDYALQMWCSSHGYAYYMDEIMSVYRRGVVGSWTHYIFTGDSRIEKIVKQIEADLNLLTRFNEETNHQYDSIIEKTKTKREFEILLVRNDLASMKNSKFKNLYRPMSPLAKITLHVKAYFPKVYYMMVGMRRKVSNLKSRRVFK